MLCRYIHKLEVGGEKECRELTWCRLGRWSSHRSSCALGEGVYR